MGTAKLDRFIHSPLRHDHPLVKDQGKCWICGQEFGPGDRTILLPQQTAAEAGSLTVEARVCHATCVLRGRRCDILPRLPIEKRDFDGVRTQVGHQQIVRTILAGKDTPCPVRTTSGHEFKLDEVEMEDPRR